jgi:outer membrane protein W
VFSQNGQVSIDSDTQLSQTFTHMLTDNWGAELLVSSAFINTVFFSGNLSGLGSIAIEKHLSPKLSAQYFFNTESNIDSYNEVGHKLLNADGS